MPAWSPSGDEKIAFQLERDEHGYPPADWEHLWAEMLSDGSYEIGNTPFFVRGISIGDVVTAREEDDMLVFQDLVRASGHSTIRVVVADVAEMPSLQEALQALGCAIEMSHLPNLLSVDVPEDVDYAIVRAYLKRGEREGRWEYEEGALRHVMPLQNDVADGLS